MGLACSRGKKRSADKKEVHEPEGSPVAQDLEAQGKIYQTNSRKLSRTSLSSSLQSKKLAVHASAIQLDMDLETACPSTNGRGTEYSSDMDMLPSDSASLFPCRISVNAEDVIEFIQQTWESNMFQTQEYLYDVLGSRREEDFITPIRKSAPYLSLMRLLRVYKNVTKIFDERVGFDPAGVINIDFEALGFSDSLGCSSCIPVFWKKVGTAATIRFSVEFPLMHQTGVVYPVGYSLMWDELDFWPRWHPAVAGPPILCNGGEQEQRSEFGSSSMRLFDENDQILRIFHLSQLIWHYKFFPPNKACFVDVLHVISNDAAFDDAENRALLTQFLPQKGIRRLGDPCDVMSFCILQKETVVVAIGMDMNIPRLTPKVLISWLLRTLIPGVVNNMFKNGGSTLLPGSDYYPRFQADRKGLYKKVNGLAELGTALEEERGYRFTQNRMPDPTDELVTLGSKNLIDLDADLAREFPH